MTTVPSYNAASLRGHWGLDPKVHFLNHGSYGACPTQVLAEQRSWRDRIERQPVAFFAREYAECIQRARARLADFVHADPDGLVFVPNVTTGVNAVLRSLDFEAGDEILITNQGYNACNNTARFVCDHSGAQLVVANLPFPCGGPDEVVDAIMGAATGRTRIALIDHIVSATGMLLPIQRIVDELQAQGIDVLVDGAHAPGQVPLNLKALGAAYYAGNCHKWLCTPKGSGLLYVREDRRAGIRPTTISHGANTSRPGRTRLQDEFDWPGTIDPTPWLCIPAAIDFFETLIPGGWNEIRTRNHNLALLARELLSEALAVEAPLPVSMIANMTAFPLPPNEGSVQRDAFSPDPLQLRLITDHGVEVPISSWPGPHDRVIRVSAQLYNDREDIETLIAALKTEGLVAGT